MLLALHTNIDILRLVGGDNDGVEIDHTVCVHAGKRLIYDYVGKQAMRIC